MSDPVEAVARGLWPSIWESPHEGAKPGVAWTLLAAKKAVRDLDAAGYVIVPREPTPEMLRAAKLALKVYLDGLSDAERRLRFGKTARLGLRVDPDLKAALRFKAMVDAGHTKP